MMRSAGARNEISSRSKAVSLEYARLRPAASTKSALVGTWWIVRRARIRNGPTVIAESQASGMCSK